MPGLGDLVQKAFYLGVGMASYATEKASVTLQELRVQAQKVADEMVARGEMTAEEARKYVDEMIQQAQTATPESGDPSQVKEPRLIEIVSEDDADKTTSTNENLDDLKNQVNALQEELKRLQRE